MDAAGDMVHEAQDAIDEDGVIVTTFTDDTSTAEAIANTLVERRSAACVRVSGPMTSTYRSQGRAETAQEWKVEARSSHERFEECIASIREVHNYDAPEIVVCSVVVWQEPHPQWAAEETGTPQAL
jgi:periplasmic divalent cation tolerance protein